MNYFFHDTFISFKSSCHGSFQQRERKKLKSVNLDFFLKQMQKKGLFL